MRYKAILLNLLSHFRRITRRGEDLLRKDRKGKFAMASKFDSRHLASPEVLPRWWNYSQASVNFPAWEVDRRVVTNAANEKKKKKKRNEKQKSYDKQKLAFEKGVYKPLVPQKANLQITRNRPVSKRRGRTKNAKGRHRVLKGWADANAVFGPICAVAWTTKHWNLYLHWTKQKSSTNKGVVCMCLFELHDGNMVHKNYILLLW